MSQGTFGFAAPPPREVIAPGALLLRGFAAVAAPALLRDLAALAIASPFRQMSVPGGGRMSVATTSCGECGWVADRRGYRYADVDPETGAPWPSLPAPFVALAAAAADAAGHVDFRPDSCLVNRYGPGAKMGLHQDADERDFAQPIVSVSLGLPAVFVFGGPARRDPTVRVPLAHGDVVVFGGPARRCFHGVLPVRDGEHPATGRCRINLTFRSAR